jgi:mannose-6-phosphate isomerase
MRPLVLDANLPTTFYRGSGRLAAFRGADLPDRPEDWVASTTARFGGEPGGRTVLPDGSTFSDLVASDPVAWTGSENPDTGLLVKLLDTGQRLPVHVHPGRAFARSHLASPYGKTEAWIIVDAAPDAAVHLGWSRQVSVPELAGWVAHQDTAAMLATTNRVPVTAGDAVLCPAGIPHAIGEGILMVEVQEPTDFSIMLETEGFPIKTEDAFLGLPSELALTCVDRHAMDAERIAALRSPAAGSLLPAEAEEFFRAESVAAGELDAGFGVLVVTGGTGQLTGDWGSMALHRGVTLAIPHAAGPARITGSVQAVFCRPA